MSESVENIQARLRTIKNCIRSIEDSIEFPDLDAAVLWAEEARQQAQWVEEKIEELRSEKGSQ